jgi:branched-chain amino acid transport system substrate-binding protein
MELAIPVNDDRQPLVGPDQLIVPWRGVKFDEKGQNVLADASMVQGLGDKYYTVWPFDLAAKDTVWPFPKWQGRQ